jgi:hypothetical protein
MPKAKQLTVFCENRPGTLAQIARVLGDANVNILAFVTIPFNEGSVQLVVDNVNKAKKALHGAALSYSEADVLHVELPNLPGPLGSFAGKLASKDHQYQLRLRDRGERRQEGNRGVCGL